ncbi:MAG: RDD family protein [Actinomycetota bacterium]
MSMNLPPPPPPTTAPSVSATQLASAGSRIGAALLDVLLMVVTLFIGWLIWSIVLWKQSTSPAKKMLGMTVVDANSGAPATIKQMVMREVLGKWVVGSVAGIVTLASLVMLWATPRRQAVWDYIGTTVVVRR